MWRTLSRMALCVGMFIVCMTVSGQTRSTVKNTNAEDIFERLGQKKSGEGVVRITQDPKMVTLMDKRIMENEEKQHITFLGYRVQVYMGNNQKKSKSDAVEREKKIKERFPDLSSYLSFVSPFWKLRVGDFRTHTEALVLSKQILSAFPEMTGEVYIVRDEETRDVSLEEAE